MGEVAGFLGNKMPPNNNTTPNPNSSTRSNYANLFHRVDKGVMDVFKKENVKIIAMKSATIAITAGVINLVSTKLLRKNLRVANTPKSFGKLFVFSGLGLVAHDVAMKKWSAEVTKSF